MFLNIVLLPVCSQYGVYTTALDQDEISGRVTCVVRKRNHAVSAIPAVSDEFHIKSPNKYPSMERYFKL